MSEVKDQMPFEGAEKDSENLLVVKNLKKYFPIKSSFFKMNIGNVKAVDGVSFAIKKGTTMGLVGESGCGKSTTLRMIAGFEDLTEGEIELCGRLVSSRKKNLYVPPEERGLGMVFQAFAVWPHMNVFENVAFPLRIQKVNKTDIERRVNEALHHTSLTGLEKVFPGDLSG